MYEIEYVSGQTYKSVFMPQLPYYYVTFLIAHMLPGDKITIIKKGQHVNVQARAGDADQQ